MKRFFILVLSLCASLAFGATTVPVQLLNPTGSSAGQAIVSTGSSSAPAWGGPSAASLTGVTQYNVAVGGSTGLAFIGPGSSGGFLISTGSSSYPAFGNTVSTLTATGLITPLGGIAGVTNGSAAGAGQVGQVITNSASGVSLTSNTPANCTSISLTAGDWNVWGSVYFNPAGTTTQSQIASGINTTSATLPAIPNYSVLTLSIPAGDVEAQTPPMQVINVSTTTTAYMIAYAQFSVSTETASCSITARRVH